MSNQDQAAQAAAAFKVGQVQVSKEKLAEKFAFFMTGGTTTYIMRNGNKVLFKQGVVPNVPKPAFVTNIEGYVAELKEQIALGHESLHTEPGYETVTDEMLDPLDAVKKQAVQDFMQTEQYQILLRQMKGVGTPDNSSTDQSTKFTGATTAGNEELAAGSDSSSGGVPPAGASAAPVSNATAPAAPITLASL